MATLTRRIGLSLGADVCWPICYEQILERLDLSIPVGGDRVRLEVERVTIEPFGKDHATRGGSYDSGARIVREVFGGEPPLPWPAPRRRVRVASASQAGSHRVRAGLAENSLNWLSECRGHSHSLLFPSFMTTPAQWKFQVMGPFSLKPGISYSVAMV